MALRSPQMDPSKLLRASNDVMVEWNTTRCILPVAYRRICNGNPGLSLLVKAYRGPFERAPKPFNSCEPLRTFPITSGNCFRRFPNTSEDFGRFSENFKKS